MINPEKYWILHEVNSLGHYQSREVSEAKSFFLEQFEQSIGEKLVEERQVQLNLFDWYTCNQTKPQAKAKLCLVCFVSQCIYYFCLHTEQKYRENYGLTRNDLFPAVLTSLKTIKSNNLSKKPVFLSQEIIDSYQYSRNSSLSTWTKIKVKGNKEYKKILKSYGIVEVTDWLILVKATIGNLERKLRQRGYSDREIVRYNNLLEAFHKVYKTELFIAREQINKSRLQEGKRKTNKPYPIPTKQQLIKISQIFLSQTNERLESQSVLDQLKKIASILRKNDILNSFLLNEIENNVSENRIISIIQDKIEADLSSIVRQVINSRIDDYLHKSKPQKEQANLLITSLNLYYCDNFSMGEIATNLGFKERSKISRLMKLKELRKDVSQLIISDLRESLNEYSTSLSEEIIDASNSEKIIQDYLEQVVKEIIEDSTKEGLNSQNRNRNSLFSRTVCACVQEMKNN